MAQDSIDLVHINTEALSWMFFVGQGAFMKARGIQFHAISSPGEYLDTFAAGEGVMVHPVDISRAITPLKDFRSTYCLWRRLRCIRPTIVEAHTSKAGILGMVAAWIARVPIRIYHNHGMALLSETGPKRMLLWWCERVACLLAHRVIYVAESVRDAAVHEGLCAPVKAKVISSINGLDAAIRFNPGSVAKNARSEVRRLNGIPEDALVIGFVGRIFWVKGVAELLSAWKDVSRRFDAAHLLVVGAVDSRLPAPPEVVERLQADPRIHLTGYIGDMPPYYAAMDVLVLPSFYEGLGYVLLEASAMEVPVVGTKIPGIVDAVCDGVTGTLVPPGDVVALARAISAYLQDSELRRTHGVAGRKYVSDRFNQEQVWNALYQEYKRLLAQLDLVPVRESF